MLLFYSEQKIIIFLFLEKRFISYGGIRLLFKNWELFGGYRIVQLTEKIIY
jgi:hypothetical protein